jgi:DNA-directed RNA polymerase sigma subunit (sigma70/sigma32)
MYDSIPDNSVETPFDSLARDDMMKAVLGLIPILNIREKAILTYRFGLNGAAPLTLEKVGKKLNITRERVRQLQNLALGKLKQALAEQR